MNQKPVATVPPANFGTPEWLEWRRPLEEVATKRGEVDPVAWADANLRRHIDASDLRALGRCRDCGQPITLRQTGKCVYAEPCGHWRAQGELRKMLPYIERARRNLTPERRASLLELIGRTE